MAPYLDTAKLRHEQLPADGLVAVTKSDTVPILPNRRPVLALYIGGTGDVVVIPTANCQDLNTPVVADEGVKFESVPAGTILQVRAVYVAATGTTATKIVAMV